MDIDKIVKLAIGKLEVGDGDIVAVVPDASMDDDAKEALVKGCSRVTELLGVKFLVFPAGVTLSVVKERKAMDTCGGHQSVFGETTSVMDPSLLQGSKLVCVRCGQPQFDTPSGVTCVNGHGGANGVLARDYRG